MKIGELLAAKEFQKLKVLNTNADLTRELATVESTETPDVASYLPKNTLLLTTAMAYKDNPLGLCELISQLNRLPSAGLAVKLGRFLNELHPDVIATADRLGFPLLQIPISATLGEIYHQVLAFVWNDQNADLAYALNTQKKFSNLMLQGASMKAMLNNLGYTLQSPVAIMSPFGEICEVNDTCTKEQQAAAGKAFDELSLYSKWNWETLRYTEGTQKIAIFPIKVVGRYSHYLFVFQSEQLSPATSALVVEQVLLIFGLWLYKNLYLLYNTIKHRGDFLKLLAHRSRENRWTDQQMLNMGAEFSLRESTCYRMVIGTLDPKSYTKFDANHFGYREERYILTFDWLERRLGECCHESVLVFPEPEGFRYVFLIQGKGLALEALLGGLHDTLLKVFQIEIIFSCGNNRYDLESVQQSYQEALEALEDGEVRAGAPFIRYFRPKNVVELLKTVLNDQAKGYCLHTLKGLAFPQDEMTLELRKTLHTYLDCKCSVTETANRMFLHRNTVKYRVKKCEEILEHDFVDADYCFQLQLSLMLVEDDR